MSEQNELTRDEEAALENTNLDALVGVEVESAATLVKTEGRKKGGGKKAAAKKTSTKPTPPAPTGEPEPEDPPTSMGDPRWHDYVMTQFTEDELDPKGRPLVHGLRRVARKVLGPLIHSKGKVVQAPNFLPNSFMMSPAVVEYEVCIMWSLEDDTPNGSYPATFTGIADIHRFNSEPDYLRHASSTAETKAEGRALRKALGLGRIIAAEEATLVPLAESLDGKIISEQIEWLDILAKRADINPLIILNAKNRDGIQYKSIRDLDTDKAGGLAEYITGITNDRSKILPEWKGYNPKWKD